MQHRRLLSSVAIPTVLALASGLQGVAFAQSGDAGAEVRWDTGGAVVAGTGCFLGVDAMIAVNGQDVSIVFSNLGVALGGDVGSPREDARTCTVKVPAHV